MNKMKTFIITSNHLYIKHLSKPIAEGVVFTNGVMIVMLTLARDEHTILKYEHFTLTPDKKNIINILDDVKNNSVFIYPDIFEDMHFEFIVEDGSKLVVDRY